MKRPENGVPDATRVAAAPGRILPGADDARLARFQTALNDALRALAGGALAGPVAQWRGFGAARIHPAWRDRLAALSALRADIDGETVRPAPVHDVAGAAELLACGYRSLARATAFTPDVPAAECRAVPWPGRGLDHVGAVAALRSELLATCGQDLRAAYVHGSYASGDRNAYSDLDTLVILRAATATEPGRLLDCARHLARSARWLLRCDLLQHHGHFVLTEIDLGWYCDAYFPAALFPWSTELFADGTPVIGRFRTDAAEAREQLAGMCGRFTAVPVRVRTGVAFDLKLWLSCFMILPALLLQVRGEPCWKGESFDRVRPLYTPGEFAVMDEVSDMRRRWRQAAPGLWGRLAGAHPLIRGALVIRGGRWGVPADIVRRAGEPAFHEALRAFAGKTLALAGVADGR